MVNLVLIDTCIWVSFFSRKKSIHKTALGELLEEDRAAIIGPILAELLLGFKKEKEAEWVASSLAGLHFLDLSWDDWCAAAKLGRHLAAKINCPFLIWSWPPPPRNIIASFIPSILILR